MPGLLPIIVGVCVTLGFILIFASGQYRRPSIWRAIGSLLLSIPAAALTFLFLGIRLAHSHGLSRFYSWPFGGAEISDRNLGWSLLFWIAAWFVVLFAASNLLPVDSDAVHRRRAQANKPI
jgi:hypothetical protein